MTDFIDGSAVSSPNVPAVAAVLREAFPELQQRAFAIMEAVLTKENAPNLPCAFTALLSLNAVNNSNNVATPMDVLETICVEFWLANKSYKLENGGVSPFYAYQDYYSYMNRLFAALDAYFSPSGKQLRFISMNTMSDEFALMISFKFSILWRWCADPVEEEYPKVKVKFTLDPDVPQLPGGKDYRPPDPCGQLPRFPLVD